MFSLKDLTLPVRTSAWKDYVGVGNHTEVSQPPKSFIGLPARGTLARRVVHDHTCIGCNLPPQHEDNQSQWQAGALQFYFYDDDLAARVIRALNHGGELCGAKKSPF